jgi:hypothetical protein
MQHRLHHGEFVQIGVKQLLDDQGFTPAGRCVVRKHLRIFARTRTPSF